MLPQTTTEDCAVNISIVSDS